MCWIKLPLLRVIELNIYMFRLTIEIILDLIPKSTEIEYNKKIPEVLRLISTADQGKTVEVAFSKLLTLHKVFI